MLRKLLVLIILLIGLKDIQAEDFDYLFKKDKKLITSTELYGGLYHQHHDFFNKAFSFQGVEAGLIFNKSVFAGLYGATFVNNLDVKIAGSTKYFSMAQAGLVLGVVYDSYKFLHTGLMLNMGYMSIIGDKKSFPIFKPDNPEINIDAMVLSPQIFAEMNILEWFRLRAGLSYNFYSFEDQSVIKKDDLQNISFSIGFLFGDFK